MAEIATQICYELTNGTPSPWHYQGYKTLWAIYYTPISKHCLHNLVQIGGLLENLVTRALKM
jgi:hypothetical protein